MKSRYPLTIITPTYNRKDYIVRLFESLKRQSIQDFQWLIVDDGSTDNTESIVNAFSDYRFRLDYKKKGNGGKHTALNYSHPFILGELVCIVDSDDWLLPSAIETIIDAQNRYLHNDNVKMLTFLKGKDSTNPVNNSFPETPVISNHIDFRVNSDRNGDCCEVIAADVFIEFPFPEHPGERFLGEGYLWNNSGFRYDTVYIPKIIYICEYLEGGLTKSGRRMRLSSPLGGMDNCNSFFNDINGRKVNKRIQFKEALLFVCYGRYAGLKYNEIVNRSHNTRIIKRYYPLGLALYYYWKIKYKE